MAEAMQRELGASSGGGVPTDGSTAACDEVGIRDGWQRKVTRPIALTEVGPWRSLSTSVRQVSWEIAEAAPMGRGAC
jgi:hypothetical protein